MGVPIGQFVFSMEVAHVVSDVGVVMGLYGWCVRMLSLVSVSPFLSVSFLIHIFTNQVSIFSLAPFYSSIPLDTHFFGS